MAGFPFSSSDVSAGDDATAAQYNALRDDIAQVVMDVQTAGETLNGATTPVPVYINTADDEFYACDGNDQTKLEFHGFAIDNGTDGNPVTVQHAGIVAGFSGLTKHAKYFVQDTAGTIGTSRGTYEVYVGVAISTTEILIDKGPNAAMQYMGSDAVSASLSSGGAGPSDTSTVPTGARFAYISFSASLYFNPNQSITYSALVPLIGPTSGSDTAFFGTNGMSASWSLSGSTLTVSASAGASGGTDSLSGTIYYYR